MKTGLPRNHHGICARTAAAASIFFAAAASAWAQAASAASAASASGSSDIDKIVRMSAFEITTTQGQGYAATNASAALKTNQALLDTPIDVMVVTSDLIKDVNYANTSDVLKYGGVVAWYQGESTMTRGSRNATNSYEDGMPGDPPFEDNVDIDSYEIISGPNEILYPTAGLSGIVIKNTKKPLPFEQNVLQASVGQFGQYRATFDSTGPLGKIGETKVGYRLVGGYQGGDAYFMNYINDHTMAHPALRFVHNQTTVDLAYDYQDVVTDGPGGVEGVMMPDGSLYTGYGRNGDGIPPGMKMDFLFRRVRASLAERFSDTWEMHLYGENWTERKNGTIVSPLTVNLAAQTFEFSIRQQAQYSDVWFVEDDVIGRYYIGPMKAQITFGFAMYDRDDHSWNHLAAGAIADQIVPFTRAGINSVVIPPLGQYPTPAVNPENRTKTIYDQGYVQEQVDIIPEWLSVVGAFTFDGLEKYTVLNIATEPPYTGTISPAHQWLHRLGAIAHLTKDIVLYGANCTSYSPSGTVNYFAMPNPNLIGTDDEVGVKTELLNGKITSNFALFSMKLSNVAVTSGTLTNILGNIYGIPIGSTTSRGWDGNIVLRPVPELQIIATGFVGTTRDQNNHPVAQTYLNSFSAFVRYDFTGALKGLAAGGGLSRLGHSIIGSGGLIAAPPQVVPPLMGLKQGTPVDLFASYRLNKHWQFEVNCQNAFDDTIVIGTEGPTYSDPIMPRTFIFGTSYTW